MSDYKIRTISLLVNRKDEPIFAEGATEVRIEDEAAGEYVMVIQHCDELKPGEVSIDPAAWPKLRKAIDRLVSKCRPD